MTSGIGARCKRSASNSRKYNNSKCVPTCHTFPCNKREFQTYIFLSVCRRTARNFKFLQIWYGKSIDGYYFYYFIIIISIIIFRLIQYYKCEAVSKESYFRINFEFYLPRRSENIINLQYLPS